MVQILSEFLKNEYKPGAHIIGRGVLPCGGKLILSGMPKANKSWVALAMILDIVRGRDVFGARYRSGKALLPIQKPWRVLYLEQELGEQGLLERLRGKDEGHPGLCTNLTPDGLQMYIQPKDTAMRLDTPDGRNYISEIVKDVRPDLTVMDPFAKFNLSKENDAQEMGAVLRVADHLIQDYGTAVMFIHHVSKPSEESPRRGLDRLRGSSAIGADVDTMIEVNRRSPDATIEPILELTFELRRGEPIERMFVQRLKDGTVEWMGDDYVYGESTASKRDSSFPKVKFKDL